MKRLLHERKRKNAGTIHNNGDTNMIEVNFVTVWHICVSENQCHRVLEDWPKLQHLLLVLHLTTHMLPRTIGTKKTLSLAGSKSVICISLYYCLWYYKVIAILICKPRNHTSTMLGKWNDRSLIKKNEKTHQIVKLKDCVRGEMMSFKKMHTRLCWGVLSVETAVSHCRCFSVRLLRLCWWGVSIRVPAVN